MITVQPLIEPLTLLEVKEHLRIDSGTFGDQIESVNSILPDSYANQTINGVGVNVQNYRVIVSLEVKNVVGTLDVTIEESDDNITYTLVEAFTQITSANDNQVFEKEYIGNKKYIRTSAVIASGNSDLSTAIILGEPFGYEDDLISTYITTARRYVEKYTNRALITQTHIMNLDRFPQCGVIEIPLPPLQSVTSIKYYDVDNNELDFDSSNYYVDILNFVGRVALNDGYNWPNAQLRPINGVKITYVCGFGDDRSDVPAEYKHAIKLLVGHYYENREATETKIPKYIEAGILSLVSLDRIFSV